MTREIRATYHWDPAALTPEQVEGAKVCRQESHHDYDDKGTTLRSTCTRCGMVRVRRMVRMGGGESQRRQAEEGAKTRERVLEVYTDYITTNGYAPNFSEVSAIADLSDRQVRRHVAVLVKEGRLVQGKGSRAIGLG